ncbi:MAG TPA: chemotaxis protein CheW [Burkholderiaceae bacterium]|nr:chemotaxis protein CheW [Burkholderiaceae bacterium]
MDHLQPAAEALAPAALAASLAMTPIQALTAGFELPEASANDTSELTAALSAAPANAPFAAARIEQRQGLRVGNLRLMIRYQDGSELADLPRVYRLPDAPPWFHGMANLHGTLIPVFGLAQYLGLAEYAGLEGPEGTKRMMLVMGSGADAVGVLIDGLPQRLRFQDEQRTEDAPVPPQLEGCIAGTYWIDEQAWLDFMPAGLFDRLEAELKRQP